MLFGWTRFRAFVVLCVSLSFQEQQHVVGGCRGIRTSAEVVVPLHLYVSIPPMPRQHAMGRKYNGVDGGIAHDWRRLGRKGTRGRGWDGRDGMAGMGWSGTGEEGKREGVYAGEPAGYLKDSET